MLGSWFPLERHTPTTEGVSNAHAFAVFSGTASEQFARLNVCSTAVAGQRSGGFIGKHGHSVPLIFVVIGKF